MIMNVVICDDDTLYIDSIAEKVTHWAKQKNLESIVNIKSYTSSEDLLQAWSKGLIINMLFIDYKIPNELSGLELAKQIRSVDVNMPIAFITNYADYACDGYTVNAVRYVLKPVSQHPISECMDIAYTRWVYMKSDSLTLENNKQLVLLPYKDIIYVEAIGHRIYFYTTSTESISIRGKLSDYEKSFPAFLIKTHRSYDVNIMYVRRIQSGCLHLAGGIVIPVSRSCANALHSSFKEYNLGDI